MYLKFIKNFLFVAGCLLCIRQGVATSLTDSLCAVETSLKICILGAVPQEAEHFILPESAYIIYCNDSPSPARSIPTSNSQVSPKSQASFFPPSMLIQENFNDHNALDDLYMISQGFNLIIMDQSVGKFLTLDVAHFTKIFSMLKPGGEFWLDPRLGAGYCQFFDISTNQSLFIESEEQVLKGLKHDIKPRNKDDTDFKKLPFYIHLSPQTTNRKIYHARQSGSWCEEQMFNCYKEYIEVWFHQHFPQPSDMSVDVYSGHYPWWNKDSNDKIHRDAVNPLHIYCVFRKAHCV